MQNYPQKFAHIVFSYHPVGGCDFPSTHQTRGWLWNLTQSSLTYFLQEPHVKLRLSFFLQFSLRKVSKIVVPLTWITYHLHRWHILQWVVNCILRMCMNREWGQEKTGKKKITTLEEYWISEVMTSTYRSFCQIILERWDTSIWM